MEKKLYVRRDLMSVFNNTRFFLQHYAMGYYLSSEEIKAMPVNRMFFPLENPGGADNYIQDAGGIFPLVPGRMYFIPACHPAVVKLDFNVYFLSIQASLEIFPGVDLFSRCTQILECDFQQETEELIKIFRSSADELFNSISFGSKVLDLFVKVLSLFSLTDFQNILALREYNDLTEYLLEHGSASTKVRDLAAVRKESREHFTRHFSARTGITPKMLIDRIIIGKCLSLIGEGYNFKEISHLLDFSDEYVFSRYFKRNTGISPRLWRERQNIYRSPEKRKVPENGKLTAENDMK